MSLGGLRGLSRYPSHTSMGWWMRICRILRCRLSVRRSPIENLADFVSEGLGCEGLLEEIDTLVEDAPMCDGVLCIPGHEEDFQVRRSLFDTFGQRASVHVWHDDVGNQ